MSDNTKCKYCGQDVGTEAAEYYIEPSNGFKSGETKESTRLKPKRSYAGEVTYVGGGKQMRSAWLLEILWELKLVVMMSFLL